MHSHMSGAVSCFQILCQFHTCSVKKNIIATDFLQCFTKARQVLCWLTGLDDEPPIEVVRVHPVLYNLSQMNIKNHLGNY